MFDLDLFGRTFGFTRRTISTVPPPHHLRLPFARSLLDARRRLPIRPRPSIPDLLTDHSRHRLLARTWAASSGLCPHHRRPDRGASCSSSHFLCCLGRFAATAGGPSDTFVSHMPNEADVCRPLYAARRRAGLAGISPKALSKLLWCGSANANPDAIAWLPTQTSSGSRRGRSGK
jgi:hypothetical protein